MTCGSGFVEEMAADDQHFDDDDYEDDDDGMDDQVGARRQPFYQPGPEPQAGSCNSNLTRQFLSTKRLQFKYLLMVAKMRIQEGLVERQMALLANAEMVKQG